ncbi:P2 phage tail completion protein R (GpR) [compost metagenome]
MSFFKPDSLKEALTKALDRAHHISDNPDRLQIELLEGSVHALATAGLGFQYRYDVAVGVLDFTGELDEIMIPLLVWLKRWETSFFLNHTQAEQGIRFERQVLDDEAANILFTLKLTEAVGFEAVEGGFEVVHRKDPPLMNTGVAAPLHQIYANGELVAHCDIHPVQG